MLDADDKRQEAGGEVAEAGKLYGFMALDVRENKSRVAEALVLRGEWHWKRENITRGKHHEVSNAKE